MAKQLKRYSTSFKVIIVLMFGIAGAYCFKTFTTGTKQIILADTVAVSHPPKKHKRHKLKSYVRAVKPIKSVIDTSQAIAKVNPTKTEIPQKIIVNKLLLVKQLPDSVKSANTFLYITYVQPNITGVVKLRAQGNFNSGIVANITSRSKVQVLEKGTTYYKVAYNNNIGFVPKWSLQIK